MTARGVAAALCAVALVGGVVGCGIKAPPRPPGAPETAAPPAPAQPSQPTPPGGAPPPRPTESTP